MTTLFDHPHSSSEPAWMRAYTTRTGAPPHLGTGKARPHRCPTCRRWTLQGLDSNLCALLATVDPNPLTPQTEAAAILTHRPTYTLHGAPGRYELYHRTPTTARHLTPAHPDTHIVLAAHTCTGPLTTHTLPITRPRTTTSSDHPPY